MPVLASVVPRAENVMVMLVLLLLLLRAVLLREAAPGEREQDAESQGERGEEREDARDASSPPTPPSPWFRRVVGGHHQKATSVSAPTLVFAAGASKERLYSSSLSLLLRTERAEREQRSALSPSLTFQ